jgi:hypothetical protein
MPDFKGFASAKVQKVVQKRCKNVAPEMAVFTEASEAARRWCEKRPR